MLKNKWFIALVAVLLTGAVAYDVWYFVLREEGGQGGQVVGSAARGDGPPGSEPGGGDGSAASDTAEGDTTAAAVLASLVDATARRRPGLRDPATVTAVRGRSADGGRWGREPLALSGALARPVPADTAPAPEPVRPPDWELSAVMTSRDRRAAVLDGRVVQEGDAVRGGGEVLEIRRGAVVIRWRGRRVTVRLPTPN